MGCALSEVNFAERQSPLETLPQTRDRSVAGGGSLPGGRGRARSAGCRSPSGGREAAAEGRASGAPGRYPRSALPPRRCAQVGALPGAGGTRLQMARGRRCCCKKSRSKYSQTNKSATHIHLVNQASIRVQLMCFWRERCASRVGGAALGHLSSLPCSATACVTPKEVARQSRYKPRAVACSLHPHVDHKFARGFSSCPVSTLLNVASLLNREAVKNKVHPEVV